MAKEELNEKELKLMFHTLGYDFTPRWNDEKGGFRNHFCTHENTSDYPIIKGLINKGYMVDNGCEPGFIGGGNFYSCTDKAKSVVVDLWLKKKKENRPSRSKRRYQAYLTWCDTFDGTFKDFIDWLTPSKEMKEYPYLFKEELAIIKDFKRRWSI